MYNYNGCEDCKNLTKNNKCNFEGVVQECLAGGYCTRYEEKEIEERVKPDLNHIYEQLESLQEDAESISTESKRLMDYVKKFMEGDKK